MNNADLPTVAEVADKLQALGSGEQIAEFFERNGVQGERYAPGRCPVAHYVSGETGREITAGLHAIIAESQQQVVADGSVLRPARSVDGFEMWSDGPIVDFILGFDDGRYPELVCRG